VLGDFLGHESEVWAVAPSPDGRFLLSGSGDQTMRLWNIATRELIVTLFRGTDGEWVMWTPQGYYTGSPGADKIVGWQINKGRDRAADYVGAEQLRQHLNRPDIVEKAILLASAEQAAREAPGTTFKLAELLARPVPLPHRLARTWVDRAHRAGAGEDRGRGDLRGDQGDPRAGQRPAGRGAGPGDRLGRLRRRRVRARRPALQGPQRGARHAHQRHWREDRDPVARAGRRRRSRQARHALSDRYRRRRVQGPRQHLRQGQQRQLRLALLGCRRAQVRGGRRAPGRLGARAHRQARAGQRRGRQGRADRRQHSRRHRPAEAGQGDRHRRAVHRRPRFKRRRQLPLPADQRRVRRRIVARLDRGVLADPAGRGRDGEGPPRAVRRHLPLRQRLQPAARQRRLSRQYHRLYGGALRPGGDGGQEARPRHLHLRGGGGPGRQGRPRRQAAGIGPGSSPTTW
jgi:hypothetical protein